MRRQMRRGTKSLLFGVHQFLWHPLTVLLAWGKLYGLPTWRELVCIFVHDWGYWQCSTMDGADGKMHPNYGADLVYGLFYSSGVKTAVEMCDLVLLHSRYLAKELGAEPSKLCWADKLSIIYEPWWFYIPRAWLSGELFEYRQRAAKYVPLTGTHRQWFEWVKQILVTLATKQKGNAVAYTDGSK